MLTSILAPPGGKKSTSTFRPITAAQSFLKELINTSLVLNEDWEAMSPNVREELWNCTQPEVLLNQLVAGRKL